MDGGIVFLSSFSYYCFGSWVTCAFGMGYKGLIKLSPKINIVLANVTITIRASHGFT